MRHNRINKYTMEKENLDVIIIGGSYSGLSAAMALGRSRRNVLIVDSQLPCNRQTPHSHNFITQDGATPAEIAHKALEQVLKYPTITLLNTIATDAQKTENGFTVTTDADDTFTTKKLIFATGIKDLLPPIKGFTECWGISVVHCPYCHGYEIRDQKTAIIANGPKAFHIASLVYNLTKEVTIITSGKAEFTHEQLVKLTHHQIPVIEKEIAEIVHNNGHLTEMIFKDGSSEQYQAAYAAVPFVQHTDLIEKTGCSLTEQGHVLVDKTGKTTVEGIYACGDNCAPMRSVATAVATGNLAGAMVNMELVHEQF